MFIATSRKGHGESILSGLERNRFTGEGHFPESETASGQPADVKSVLIMPRCRNANRRPFMTEKVRRKIEKVTETL
jgi:hypothetical protein